MATLHDDLLAALDAAEVTSPTAFSFQGEARDLSAWAPPPTWADSSSSAEEDPALLAALEGELYARFYTRPTAGTGMASGDPLAQRDLLSALSAANTGQGTWEPGWKIDHIDEDGRVAVAKDGLTFWVEPSGLRVHSAPIQPGEFCRVRVAKELRGLMPGFYVAIGDGDPDDSRDAPEPLVRFYWHLRPESAVPYIAAVTGALNARGVPFRTKVLSEPSSYVRADAGVLYLGRRRLREIGDAIARIHRTIAPGLRPEVPRFTKGLAPGLGLAEDPSNGLSFGQHRCRLVARAAWRSFSRGDAGRDSRSQALAAEFRDAGLDPARPYLEPRSVDDYVLDPTAEQPRAVRRARARPPSKSEARKKAKGRRS
jgi:hypothetical protein